jgi:hypothetical protein
MNPAPSFSTGCRIVAEFDDDASSFADAEPEFVPVEAPPVPTLATLLQSAFLTTSEEAAVAAKKQWLRVIRRFTKPDPGTKRHLRLPDSEEPEGSQVEVEYGRGAVGERPLCQAGSRVDASDKFFLVLYRTEAVAGRSGEDGSWVTEKAIHIPWTEIICLGVSVRRRIDTKQKSGTA